MQTNDSYFLGDTNITLQSKDQEMFKNKVEKRTHKEMVYLAKNDLEFCSLFPLEQVIASSAKVKL